MRWHLNGVDHFPRARRAEWSPVGAAEPINSRLRRSTPTPRSARRAREQVLVHTGHAPRDEAAELRRLQRENAEMRPANEILRTECASLAAEVDRPTRAK